MNNQQPNQKINFAEANQFDNLEMAKEDKSMSKIEEIEQKFTHEQKAEHELAHEQNITAHIPGGSAMPSARLRQSPTWIKGINRSLV